MGTWFDAVPPNPEAEIAPWNLVHPEDPPSAPVPLKADLKDPGTTEEGLVRILLVEDNHADVFLIREILRTHHILAVLDVIDDGDKALRVLDQLDADPERHCPDLILLDLNLPKRSGHEVLERIRRTGRCQNVPVVIVTSSGSPGDLAAIRRFEGAAYFQKPANLDAYMLLGDLIQRTLGKH